ncbi:MAG: response regulator, partial [Gammaproteobacteria bacterium]|nr:response regulator [Gammaproteobacteria bacterium]
EIQHATERGSALTKKLLAFSRQEPTQPENVNVNQLLLDTQNMLEKTLTARINLDYRLADNIWSIYIDKGDLEDAVLNLCINAMHAMPDGGDVLITTSNQKLSNHKATILNLAAGEYVQLSISDTGCGIHEDALNQVFDPFFTTKGTSGTGLGLTQVYGAVKRAKGTITVDSKLNKGTNISIYFPHIHDPNEESLSVPEKVINQYGTESILVVDDERSICELSKNLLSSKGYQVLIADNGKTALELLENNQIDLLLSDVIMPNMDGYKLADIVRNKFPHVKIQLVSGFDDDKKRTEKDNTLSKNILQKPYTASQLFTVVRKVLDS